MMRVSSVGSTTDWASTQLDEGSQALTARRAFLALMVAAVLIRLVLVWFVRDMDLQITDERHYATLAHNLVAGNGFAWGPGAPTSIRPPLFPFFVAALWWLTSTESATLVRLAQIPLSLLSVAVVYLLGRRLFNPRVGLLAAAGLACYPSLLFSGVLVLTETLFTALLLLTLLGCVALISRPSAWIALATSAALGAAALTRSVMAPFIVLLVAMSIIGLRASLPARLRVAAMLCLGFVAVVGPWSVRNTRLQGTFTLVDTMGGLNLMMGNYAYTPEDRMWDAISLNGDKAWDRDRPAQAPDGGPWTEGKKDQWAKQQGLDYMKAHPLTTLRRSVLKFADFWGIEREFIAGVQSRLYQPPLFAAVAIALAIVISYAAVMVLGAIGVSLAPPDNWRAHVLLVVVMLFIAGVHSVVFGHSRYHLPLVPVLLVYGGAAVDAGVWRAWTGKGAVVATALLLMFVAIWTYEVFVQDAARVAAFARLVGAR